MAAAASVAEAEGSEVLDLEDSLAAAAVVLAAALAVPVAALAALAVGGSYRSGHSLPFLHPGANAH